MNKEKTTFQVRDLRNRLNRALKKKQELNNRIMKAIEEINYYDLQAKHLDDDIYLDETLANNLLRILKGEDK